MSGLFDSLKVIGQTGINMLNSAGNVLTLGQVKEITGKQSMDYQVKKTDTQLQKVAGAVVNNPFTAAGFITAGATGLISKGASALWNSANILTKTAVIVTAPTTATLAIKNAGNIGSIALNAPSNQAKLVDDVGNYIDKMLDKDISVKDKISDTKNLVKEHPIAAGTAAGALGVGALVAGWKLSQPITTALNTNAVNKSTLTTNSNYEQIAAKQAKESENKINNLMLDFQKEMNNMKFSMTEQNLKSQMDMFQYLNNQPGAYGALGTSPFIASQLTPIEQPIKQVNPIETPKTMGEIGKAKPKKKNTKKKTTKKKTAKKKTTKKKSLNTSKKKKKKR